MAEYKLTYFNLRGRGECARLLFACAQQQFDDIRYPMNEKFEHQEMLDDREKNPELFPFGQLPVLEADGVKISQSHAIERFLAKRFGFFGEAGSIERAQIDAVGEHCQDIFAAFIRCVLGASSEEEKGENLQKHYGEYFPKAAAALEKRLDEAGSGFMVGDKCSLADVQVYYYVLAVGVPDMIKNAIGESCPKLMALREKVEDIEGVKKWLQVRPDTFF